MDPQTTNPTALDASSSAQDSFADFDYDDVHPSQLTMGSMRHCFDCMCVSPEILNGCSSDFRLTRDSFVMPVHGVLFEKLREMHDMGLEIEIVPITKILHKRGLLDDIGGASVVFTFHAFACTVDHFENYFSQPEHRHDLRGIIDAHASSPHNPFAGRGVRQGDHTSQDLKLRDAAAEVLEHFKKLFAGNKAAMGPST